MVCLGVNRISMVAQYLGSFLVEFIATKGYIITVGDFLHEIWFVSYPFPVYILLISALCTSAWLWLCFLIAFILKMIMTIPIPARWLNRVIDVDHHPARALGLISAVFCTAVWALRAGVIEFV